MTQDATSFFDSQHLFERAYAMTRFLQAAFSMILGVVILTGCKDPFHDDHSHDEHDVITTVTLRFVNTADSNDVVTAVWEDIDGIGGANPNRIDSVTLKKAASYACSVSFENRSVTPVVNVTQDILTDRNNHQVFYDLSSYLGQIAVEDLDARNLPVGLRFRLITPMDASAVPGQLKLSLYHYDDESDKTGTTRGSETDIEVAFPTFLQ